MQHLRPLKAALVSFFNDLAWRRLTGASPKLFDTS